MKYIFLPKLVIIKLFLKYKEKCKKLEEELRSQKYKLGTWTYTREAELLDQIALYRRDHTRLLELIGVKDTIIINLEKARWTITRRD